MAYIDAMMPPEVDDAAVAQQLYPWMKRPSPPSPLVPPAEQPLPAMPAPRMPAASQTTARAALPPPAQPGSALSAVPVGPAAAKTADPDVQNAPLQPVTLGPQAQPAPPPTAAGALAASKAPVLHGFKKAIDIAGQVFTPSLEQAIPGTPGNYEAKVRPELEQRAKEEAVTTAAGMAGRKDEATISRDQAEAANLNAEAQERLNPKPKTRGVIIKDPNGDPIPALQDMKSGEITDETGKPIPGATMWEKTPAPKPEEKILGHTIAELKGEMTANAGLYPGGWMDGAAGFKNQKAAAMALDKAKADADRAPKDTSSREASRSDRNYQFNAKELDNERKPLEATMQKISAATSNIDLKSPQADALLAPQILSLSAGGAGSGLRMNEAEIARIVGGRTVWEGIKASANRWSTDPSHPQIPESQRAQMVQILKAAAEKGTTKSGILEWADSALINSDDPKEQRQIVANARKLMDAVDQGKRIQKNKTTGEFRIAPE